MSVKLEFHCYMHCGDEVELHNHPILHDDLDEDRHYLGKLSLLTIPMTDWSQYYKSLQRLFSEEDTRHHAIVVDMERRCVLPDTYISFPSMVELLMYCKGAGIIEGLTGDKFILLPLKMIGEKKSDRYHTKPTNCGL